jgi:hypothetical protein
LANELWARLPHTWKTVDSFMHRILQRFFGAIAGAGLALPRAGERWRLAKVALET